MRRTGTTRRGALTATGATVLGATLAGCGGDDGREDSTIADARAAAAQVENTLRLTAATTSRKLLVRYDQVVKAYPGTAAGLAPLRDAVRAHTTALSQGEGGTLPLSHPPATDAKAAVKELAAAERRTADAHTATLLKAPPELARLLASIAAAGAAHAYLLTEMAKETSS
ncbi:MULTISPECIES: hypothetical protein [Streptomyces]|uniref:hypothetical protein n=1 Tax=unclassified Streptomyces TaxID=2593676 RepID=UPI00087FEBD5|nr:MULTISPECIES: hypothetical protein [unclassified Streptomyces]MDX2733157.1 hypothetical protein [Streptomyces sp. PA03-2a]MDX3771610.1 hypothetical protein [Streptomyces sp. AK08-01B]MDX3821193.1 hypothetical protein [Streptomyces sp. AK08-01A]SCZ17029.1 hypothetical protein SAMN02745898_1217 [Streptomyces sp. 136MFCol5.1]SFT31885.1 hypothetical protein SAMN04487982_1257 [Streptomyces sp. ok210]